MIMSCNLLLYNSTVFPLKCLCSQSRSAWFFVWFLWWNLRCLWCTKFWRACAENCSPPKVEDGACSGFL